MDRRLLVTLIVLLAGAVTLSAQDSTDRKAPTGRDKDRPAREEARRQGADQDRSATDRMRRPAGPGERERLKKARERWDELSTEEKEAIRERAKQFQSRVRQQAAEILRSSGLQLDEETRREFFEHYLIRRRELERELHEDMQRERESRLAALLEELKEEFSPKQKE